MAYKCLECGNIFEEGEQAKWIEPHGEKMNGCPLCKGGYEETIPCEICGSEHLSDELHGGVCDECITKYAYDAEMCYKIGQNDHEKVNINCFLAAIFSEKEINEILHREMEIIAKYALVNGSSFIDNDIEWFGEMLVEEVKKNECEKK